MQPFITDQNQVEKIDGMTLEYPYCMHERDLTDFIVPWHWHEELELGYLETGSSLIRTMDRDYLVGEGDGFFINTNVADTKRSASPGMPVLEVNHIFHSIFIGGHFGSLITRKYLTPVLQNQQLAVHVIRRGTPEADAVLASLARLRELNGMPGQEIAIRSGLSEAWLLLLAELRAHFEAVPPVEPERQARMKNMLSHIHRNYGEKLTLEEIAASAGVSAREADRLFQRVVRQTPFAYLMSYRLDRARELLTATDLPVTEIACRCGFTDSAYMGRQFRKAYGLSPRAYRR